MGWRESVNQVLRRTTGYQFTRAAVNGTANGTANGNGHLPAGRPLPKDYDDAARAVIQRVRPRTMTSPERLHAFILATRYVTRYAVPGAIVECGVWRGGSMQASALTLAELGATDRDLYLFDTFEGMPPPTKEDVRHDGRSAEYMLSRLSKDRGIWAYATLDDVRSGFDDVPYPSERIHFVQGMVENTVPEQAPEQIAVLRLDTDWYASTKHELEHLYPRLVSGGVLLIDDYGYWQGARKAVDEFLEITGERLLLQRMDEGRIAVKP
ncbi:putative methyltransferase [Beutenbergia cavernae DSM 12333]|uniref:Putative methyltransferase n=1 Tax=Beutenbergia cavernae (strain ATCC BAA-8 / DSM 12333 / CCUG 43141 / JCM 11478 / NBRC 16432 / NCIMB 13614 / HKI 0122) TaxID=471853 RepID=C5C159_BEUC1|nr:TylF/MycF/NovP-related O-methyltransferase [Beutenbergia cavernae]ACQ79463.1 putative methyltransferase [Beutenbergia cavernae DSM 12333]